jgi:galactokinase
MACAAGGLVAIDFENPTAPVMEKVPFDFAAQGYRLILVNTGSSHADLSEDYSAIPKEMKRIASFFKQEVLRGLRVEDLVENLPALRTRFGDRAVLRALHFIEENNRVDEETRALKANDFRAFLRLVNESGNSSYKYVQNVHTGDPAAQHVALCLGLTDVFFRLNGLEGKAACRVHGGGFAGVIQVFLPQDRICAYREYMHSALGWDRRHSPDPDPVFVMSIRPCGLSSLY